MGLKLRDYQIQAVDAVFAAWETMKRPAVVLPTGAGKTVIFTAMADRLAEEGSNTLILVHRDELVRQTVQKVHAVAPARSVGIVQASRDEWEHSIVVASVQTLSRRNRLERVPMDHFDRIVVDEAHHAAADSYTRILRYFGAFDVSRRCRAVGFTATMKREDKRGLGNVWEEIVFKRDILYMIRNGYLVDVQGRRIQLDRLNLDGVRKTAGDYSDSSLSEALSSAGAPDIMARAYQEHATGRLAMSFHPTVAIAQETHDVYKSYGIRSAVITGETPHEERQLIYKAARDGELDILANCMVLTEGFDLPPVSCVMIGRPTQSAGLYVQMAGRGLRPFPGKRDALILDFVGATEDHRLRSIADLSETKVPVPDGKTLKDAHDDYVEQEPAVVDTVSETGRAYTTSDVSLFEKSSSAWMRTFRGYWFVPTREWLFAVLPDDKSETTFTARTVYKGFGKGQKGKSLVSGVPLDYAMAWAESAAEELDPSIASKGASWRKRKDKASPAQINYAGRLGIQFDPDKITKRELSEKIEIVIGSRKLDRYEPTH